MFGVRSLCCIVLALWLGGACTVTVAPIKLQPDAKSGDDGLPASDGAPKCQGGGGVYADAGVSLSSGLLAHYTCDQAVETALPDVSGNNRNAMLASTATGDAGFRFVTGKVGKALYMSSAYNAHVVLPAGMLADACEATVATWVFLNSRLKPLQRVWTFSTGSNAYMYLTTDHNLSGLMRSGITVKTNGDSEFVEGPGALPTGVWTHVTVVLDSTGLVLYVDGVQVDVNPNNSVRPADLGKTLYDYIGRSNYNWDPYLEGTIDEFRVYNRALSPAEIRALAGA